VSQLAWCGGGCFDSRRRVNSTVMLQRRTMVIRRRRFRVGAVSWLLALSCFTPIDTSHAQGNAPPPPLGRLVDIGGRRLHLYCLYSGSPTVIMEQGQSGFAIDWALVQPGVAKITRVCTYDRAGYAGSERGPATGSV